jgi:hypothetical protein
LAALLLALIQRPGLAASDTKINLQLDPLTFLSDVADVWSPTGSTGHVQGGQYGGYLLPMGPFFAILRWIGLQPWLVQRLWLAALLAVAAWGMVALVDHFYSPRRSWAHLAAGSFVLLNAFVVTFVNRTSVMLLALAILPWLLVAVQKGLREPRGWKQPVVIALLITLSGGGVNAAVTAWMLVGPGVLCCYEILLRRVSVRALASFLLRATPVALAASLWWIGPVLVQSAYGVDFLKFTEQPGTIWSSGSLTESLRLMGYWVSYLGVGFGNPRQAFYADTPVMLFAAPVVVAGLLMAAIPILGVRWTARRTYAPFFLLLLLVGLIVMGVGWPEGTPLRKASYFAYNHFPAIQFLRSTYKAGPLVLVSLAALAGLGADQLARFVVSRKGSAFAMARVLLPVAALLVMATAAWPLVRGEAIDPAVSWKAIPTAWSQTASQLDASLSRNKRAMVLPGQLYSFYNWGATVDPILPAISDRPVVARSYVPWTDQRATDLQWTIDGLVQQQRVLPGQLTALLGLLGVGQVVTGTDDRRLLSGAATPSDGERALRLDGELTPLGGAGPSTTFTPTAGTIESPVRLQQVRRSAVAGGRGLVRVLPTAPETVVDGSAETLAALAAVGSLPKKNPIFYATDRSSAELKAAAKHGAEFVIGDGNRRRVVVASRLRQSLGATVGANDQFSADAAVLNRESATSSDSQTVAEYSSLSSITAPFSPGVAQFPEYRPFAAIDGDLKTAWHADRYLQEEEWYLQLELRKKIDIPYLAVFPDNTPKVTVKAISVNGKRFEVHSGWNRLNVDLHQVKSLKIALAQVAAPSTRPGGVGGIRELRIPGVKVTERLRLPVSLTDQLQGSDLDHSSLRYLLTRTTGDDPYRRDPSGVGDQGSLSRDRGDGELFFSRRFEAPTSRQYEVSGLATVGAATADSQIDRLAGLKGPFMAESSSRFLGRPGWRASRAFDGDRGQSWIGGWNGSGVAWIGWSGLGELSLKSLRLAPPVGAVRFPTRVRLVVDGRRGPSINVNRSGVVRLPAQVSGTAFRLEILSARFLSDATGAERQRRAVGIGEIVVDGLAAPSVPTKGALPANCGVALLSANGTDVSLRASGTLERLDSGMPLKVGQCEASRSLALPRGSIVVRSLPAVMVPELIDLYSARPHGNTRVVGGGEVTKIGGGSPSNRSGYEVSLSGRSWLALAETWNRGWKASCDGRDLGSSVPIDGFANGWLAPADCHSVAFRFGPNHYVQVLYVVSGGVLLALLAFLAWLTLSQRRAGRLSTLAELDDLPGESAIGALGWRRALLFGAVAGAVIAFVFALRAGVVLGPIVALLLWRGVGNRALFLTAGVLLGVVVPALYLLVPVDNHGGYNSNYAGELVSAHWTAVVAVSIAALALVRSIVAARRG